MPFSGPGDPGLPSNVKKAPEKARRQWRHVLDHELSDATLAHRLARFFEQYELPDDAVRCYGRAIALSPDRPENYSALAALGYARQDKAKATATLDRRVEANPDNAAAYVESACRASKSKRVQ